MRAMYANQRPAPIWSIRTVSTSHHIPLDYGNRDEILKQHTSWLNIKCGVVIVYQPFLSELQHFLVCLVAVDSILELRRREAKATHSCFRGATVWSWGGDGIPHASVSQPACFTVVQARELPGGVELSHPGHLGAVLPTRLLSLCQVHPLRLLKKEDFSCWETIYFNVYIHCLCMIHLHKHI